MSLRYALLGLLADSPASGYDLTQRFEKQLQMIWPAKHPQIYGELGKLADAGLIAVDSEGPRGRKVYAITPEGLAEVRRWLTEEPVDHTARLEALLRSLFYWLMDPEDLGEHLASEAAFYRAAAAGFREYAAAKDRGDYGDAPSVKSMRMTIEAGIRLYEALADWAEWAQTVPPPGPAAEGAASEGSEAER
ncbi:PadR family transcriptional regulator [Glycomyces artemisiae]|uniref:PadR family transcriptional regulator n=1 Tax=Glycomyces artemisiae TaxID=1076443 RepID=A0A2T0UDL6_9ACTN|nr:PadR family transcriptional regulator [Glycomyces artemisiae]PRY55992.1 PadR family transcriptional regulator [Glycomyces artemisiae]